MVSQNPSPEKVANVRPPRKKLGELWIFAEILGVQNPGFSTSQSSRVLQNKFLAFFYEGLKVLHRAGAVATHIRKLRISSVEKRLKRLQNCNLPYFFLQLLSEYYVFEKSIS